MPDTMQMSWSNHGTNVEIAQDEEYLYLRVNITDEAKASAEDSKSGKTKLLGSTGGFVKLGHGVSLSLNVSYKE